VSILHKGIGSFKNTKENFMAGQNVLEITDKNFQETIKTGVTLVDFWAPWCGPCRMLGPVVEQLAADFTDKAKIGKLNVDDNQQTAVAFSVNSIPTILIFKDGKLVKQFVGVQSKDALTKEINSVL